MILWHLDNAQRAGLRFNSNALRDLIQSVSIDVLDLDCQHIQPLRKLPMQRQTTNRS